MGRNSINKIAKRVSREENEPHENVLEKEELVKKVYEKMKTVIGNESSVTYKLHEPYPSMGSVSVEGKDVVIEDSVKFASMIAMATNFEVYPKTDGTVKMTLTFHGLTKKLKEGE